MPVVFRLISRNGLQKCKKKEKENCHFFKSHRFNFYAYGSIRKNQMKEFRQKIRKCTSLNDNTIARYLDILNVNVKQFFVNTITIGTWNGISCNRVIIQSIHNHEDASLAL